MSVKTSLATTRDLKTRPGFEGNLADGRRRCQAHNKSGTQCGKEALAGMRVCYIHGGRSPLAQRKADERLNGDKVMHYVEGQVGRILREMGEEVPMDPLTGLEHACNVAGQWVAATSIMLGSRDSVLGRNRFEEEVIHPLTTLHGEWLDRWGRLQKLAIDAGIDQRRLALAETDARKLASAVSSALEDAELNPEQKEKFRASLARELRISHPVSVSEPAGPPEDSV